MHDLLQQEWMIKAWGYFESGGYARDKRREHSNQTASIEDMGQSIQIVETGRRELAGTASDANRHTQDD